MEGRWGKAAAVVMAREGGKRKGEGEEKKTT